MVTYLGSLVQSCCGEGGRLETNITGVAGGSARSVSVALGLPPLTRVCFHGLHFSGSRLLCQELFKAALGCVHFPDLSRSGSRSRVLPKGADSVGPVFFALPRSEQLR